MTLVVDIGYGLGAYYGLNPTGLPFLVNLEAFAAQLMRGFLKSRLYYQLEFN